MGRMIICDTWTSSGGRVNKSIIRNKNNALYSDLLNQISRNSMQEALFTMLSDTFSLVKFENPGPKSEI